MADSSASLVISIHREWPWGLAMWTDAEATDPLPDAFDDAGVAAAQTAIVAGILHAVDGPATAQLWLGEPPDTLLSEVDWHPSLSKFPPSPLLEGSLRSLLVDSLHYIRRSDGVEALYDLGRDFFEARNLAGVPQYRAALLDARTRLEAATRGSELGARRSALGPRH